jgi:ABC-2 type transport system permease protein
MNKMLTVARREYLYNLRRKSFLFAVFGVPIFTFVVWFIVFAVIADDEENLEQVGQVGYADQSGVLADAVYPEAHPDLFVPYETEDETRAALDAGEIGAYFVLPEDYLETGEVEMVSFGSIPEALEDAIETFLLTNLSRELSADVPLERIQDPVDLTIQVADSGRTLTEANLPALIFIPLIFAFVFLMASNVTSGFLMNGIVEEKANRIMEILVTSVTPTQMFLGKILGLGALGLTQVVIWGVAGLLLIQAGQAIPFLSGVTFPTDMMILFVVYFILSYFLLASLMAGLGAVAGSEEESRQYSGILSLVFVIPFFFLTTLISEPNGPVAIALTLIPFTAPMTTLLRYGLSTVPTWQLIASLIILLVTALLVVWLSSRIFRWALLLYGKRVGPRELWRVIRQSPQTATVEARTAKENAA